jgi:pyruvate,water dikinase
MVRSDLGDAGVLFALDTESEFPEVVLINSSNGLGENVIKGRVDPNELLVFKTTLNAGFRPILKWTVGAKQEKLICAHRGD